MKAYMRPTVEGNLSNGMSAVIIVQVSTKGVPVPHGSCVRITARKDGGVESVYVFEKDVSDGPIAALWYIVNDGTMIDWPLEHDGNFWRKATFGPRCPCWLGLPCKTIDSLFQRAIYAAEGKKKEALYRDTTFVQAVASLMSRLTATAGIEPAELVPVEIRDAIVKIVGI